MKKNKTFLLCVGAQKCGTTWLHSQLKKSKKINFGMMKEYHVFNSIYSEHFKNAKENLIKSIQITKNDQVKEKKSKRLSFIENTENYFNYFDELYQSNKQTEIVGDISPSYSMLDSNAYYQIKKNLEKRGFQVKVIFLMRDPIERTWSQIRMTVRDKDKSTLPNDSVLIRNIYKKPHMHLRSNYLRTMHELEKTFEKENIYYGFYEDLFTESSYKKLIDFLEVEIGKPDFNFKTNVSPKSTKLDLDLKKEIANFYSDLYNHIDEMTNGYSKEIWSGYKYL